MARLDLLQRLQAPEVLADDVSAGGKREQKQHAQRDGD
jgi:hypothetical protein